MKTDGSPDQPRAENGQWGEGGAGGASGESGGGGGGGGSSGAGSDKPATSYPKRELAPENEHTTAMPEHPVGKDVNNSQKMAEYHKAAAEHFASRGEKGLAEGHATIAEKHEKRAAKERQKENRMKGQKSDDAKDLVAAWCGYDWEDNRCEAWPGKICPTCLKPIPIVEGLIAPHMRDAAAPWKPEEDHMCPSGGQVATADAARRAGGMWAVVDPDIGKVLSSHQTRPEALASIREVQRAVEGKQDGERVPRFDLAQLAAPALTADGFLQVEGRVARTGVQEYRNADGSTRRELRLPEEVSASVAGFALAPFTNDHPSNGVTPENARDTVVGAVGDAQLGGDGWVTAPIRIYAADAIEATKGGRAQLSVGYSCRLDFAPGQWQGQKYDAVQREIVVNHVALVDLARAGTQARLRLDAATADLACDTPPVTISTSETNTMPHELRIDGLVFQVNDPNAQAAYDRALKQRDDSIAAMTVRVTNADTLVATANKDRDTAQAACDNAQAELKTVLAEKLAGLTVTVADARDPEKFAPALRAVVEAAAASRASLLLEARRHLGVNERFDAYVDPKTAKDVPAKSDLEIKKLVVEKLDKDVKLDGKSADYVQARYDGLVEAASKGQPKPLEQLRATVNAPPIQTNDAAPTDARAARAAFEAKMIADNLGNAKRN